MRCLARPAATCFFAVMAPAAAAAGATTEFVGPNPAVASLATEDLPAGVAEVITHPDGTRTRIVLPQALGQGIAMISRASPDDALNESVGVARDPSGISDLFLQRGGQATAPVTHDRPRRQLLGEYTYTALSDGRPRGWERFLMTIHEDGSRSLLMWNDIHARRAQMTTLVLVDADFLPRAAWANYWNESGYKGSALLRRESSGIAVDSVGAWGRHQETVTVDGHFSLGTHPVAGDGWHVHDEQAQVLALIASPDPLEAITGAARALPVERIGEETLSVPAGRFDTVHWRLAGRSDVWVHGEDRLVISMRQAGSDREYVLTRLERRP